MRPARRWPLWARLGLAVLLGALGAFGLAPWGLWPLTLLVLLLVPTLLAGVGSVRQAMLIGLALGVGWFANGLVWIVEPFQVDAARYGWMAPFALVLMAMGGGAFWAVAFGVAQKLGRSHGVRVVALILTWSLVEFARAYLFTGFPWAALAQIWPGTDTALLLAWIGPHGLALATLLATLLPGLALVRPGAPLLKLASVVPGVILLVASVVLAQARPATAPLTGKIVRLIQPNALQHQKWDPAFTSLFFRRQIEFTQGDDGTGPRPDLIVWPETAVPVLLNNSAPVFQTIAEAAAGTPVVLGIQRTKGVQIYNSLVYLDSRGQVAGLYDKHHLVPFGEYIPFGDLAARFGLHGLAAQSGNGFSAGPGAKIMDLGDLGKALPLICYEAVFPQDILRVGERANFLLQITNDAWFGQNSGPFQHLAQAQMRAIEQGLPMIRVANTGVSAMIDPWGRILAELPLGTAGYVDAGLPDPLAPTFYARSGDKFVFLLLLIAFFGLFGLRSRRIKVI